MFCPRCGKSEQVPDSYCRQCGLLLPDLQRLETREISPVDHLKANTALSALTIFASLTLSFLLFTILGFTSATHPLIYATAGILIAIAGWHIQSLIRIIKLRKQWERRAPLTDRETTSLKSASTAKLLEQPDYTDVTPTSVTEHTTRHLVEKHRS